MTTDPNLVKETLHDTEEHMKKTIHAFEMDLRAFRTGRASPAIVERNQNVTIVTVMAAHSRSTSTKARHN